MAADGGLRQLVRYSIEELGPVDASNRLADYFLSEVSAIALHSSVLGCEFCRTSLEAIAKTSGAPAERLIDDLLSHLTLESDLASLTKEG